MLTSLLARNWAREDEVATLNKVGVDITVVLGTTSMPVHQVLRLGRGAVIELDSTEEDAVSVLANNHRVAEGTVVVNGNRIAVEVSRLLPRAPDMRSRGFSALWRPLWAGNLFVTCRWRRWTGDVTPHAVMA